MPTYRSVNIVLHSQFDVETFPEYCPPLQEHYTRPVPKLIDDTTSTRSVYIPVLPGSLFWIGYSVSPPVPDGHFFLFKLFINGAHIVSWSTGKEEGWKGKTMFGLYDRPEDEDGKRRVEKRALSFTSPGQNGWDDVKDTFDGKMCMEIRVHRAHGRKRIEKQIEPYRETEHANNAKGIDLVNAGRANAEQPKRFYKFALTDPVDQPFATFKYYYRTWEQLHELGVLDEDTMGQDNLPVIEPYDAEGSQSSVSNARNVSRASTKGDDIFYECGENAIEAKDDAAAQSISETRDNATSSERPRAYVPRGAPSKKASGETLKTGEPTPKRHSGVGTPPQFYRLSVPPSLKLDLPKQTIKLLPPDPSKSSSPTWSTCYRPHPAYPVEEWRMRTPSPVKSIRESISTPPMEKSRASSLFNAFTSTWKRRGASGCEDGKDKDKQGGPRSVSH
jgi:hypothetical protein